MAGQSNPAGTTAQDGTFAAPPLFAPGELRELGDRGARALRRNSHVALRIFLGILALTALAIPLLPRSYHVDASLLALPGEGAPGAARQTATDPGGLVEAAAQVVVSHENLRSIIRSQDLVVEAELNRGLLQRTTDRIDRLLGIAPSNPAQRERKMIRHLEKNLKVQAKGGQVVIGFDWPDPRTAVEVVSEVQRNLIQARREAELAPMERRLESLQASEVDAERRVKELADRVAAALQSKRRGARAATVRSLQAEGRFRDLPDPRLAAARTDLVARRKVIAEMEETRRKRLSELNAALAEQRATLGPENAALLETEEKLHALQADGAQIERLRTEEQERLAAYVHMGGREAELSAEAFAPWPAELKEDEPSVAFDKARMAFEEAALGRLRSEVEQARQSVAAAQAAFSSRYIVLSPAEMPDRPAFPNVPLLLLAAALGGAFAAIAAAVAADFFGSDVAEEQPAPAVLAKVPVA